MDFLIELRQVHVLVLCLTALVIAVADHDAIQYIQGKKPLLEKNRLLRLHYGIVVGLIGMVLTGAGLFYDAWGELMYEPAFYIKMIFVIALIINSVTIRALIPVASERPYAELTTHNRFDIVRSGLISFLGWTGAVVVGVFFL